ncbi:ferritin-like domain-containing protein [Micromonospora sp. NPDC003197]
MNEQLAAALAAEHAAIFAYGPIGVRLSGAARREARAAETAHRNRRDALVTLLTRDGSTPPAPEPAYTLPFPVTDRASALRLAITVEERTAAAWRAALPTTTDADRAQALTGLTDCAVRATRFRKQAGTTPATVPFPGRQS